MGILIAALAFAGLVALNSALGYSFFSSGLVLASLTAVVSGYAYAFLVGRLNPNWNTALRLLQAAMLVSLGVGLLGMQQVLSYQQNVDPSQDPAAINAAGQTLFILQAVGIGLALRKLKPRNLLPDFEASGE